MTNPSLLAPVVLLAALSGCDELGNCPEENKTPVVVESGTTRVEAGIYVSSGWDDTLVRFPAKTLMRFKHDLGTRPEIVTTFVSFSPDGVAGSDVTENAGNQARIVCVDAHEIDIVNATCEDEFYVRIAAYASGEDSTKEVCPLKKDLD